MWDAGEVRSVADGHIMNVIESCRAPLGDSTLRVIPHGRTRFLDDPSYHLHTGMTGLFEVIADAPCGEALEVSDQLGAEDDVGLLLLTEPVLGVGDRVAQGREGPGEGVADLVEGVVDGQAGVGDDSEVVLSHSHSP